MLPIHPRWNNKTPVFFVNKCIIIIASFNTIFHPQEHAAFQYPLSFNTNTYLHKIGLFIIYGIIYNTSIIMWYPSLSFQRTIPFTHTVPYQYQQYKFQHTTSTASWLTCSSQSLSAWSVKEKTNKRLSARAVNGYANILDTSQISIYLYSVLCSYLSNSQFKVFLSNMNSPFSESVHACFCAHTLHFSSWCSWHHFSNLTKVDATGQIHLTWVDLENVLTSLRNDTI